MSLSEIAFVDSVDISSCGFSRVKGKRAMKGLRFIGKDSASLINGGEAVCCVSACGSLIVDSSLLISKAAGVMVGENEGEKKGGANNEGERKGDVPTGGKVGVIVEENQGAPSGLKKVEKIREKKKIDQKIMAVKLTKFQKHKERDGP